MKKPSLHKTYQILVVLAGVIVCSLSAYKLYYSPSNLYPFDLSFLLLAVVTVVIASRISVPIPYESGFITVNDTLIFLTILLYGGEAAVLLGAAEGLFSWLSSPKPLKKLTVMMNAGSMACSTFASVWALHLLFGSTSEITKGEYTPVFIGALVIMGVVQYLVNSSLIAVHAALKNNTPIFNTWVEYYLWASITYLAGAFAAGVTAKLVVSYGMYGFYGLILATPVIFIIYLTYRTYLKNIETSAAAAKAQEAQKFYEEREQLREQFAQIEKLSALGELASGVAHNFNNTLAGILGRAEILRQSADVEEIRRGLDIITKVAEDGAQTVRRIQDFARQRRDHDFAPLAVDQLLSDIGEITRPRWKNLAEARNVQIKLELHADSEATIMGDASELREVLVNLVFNAIDAMPEGGKLQLSTKKIEGFVTISVADTGTGMSEETRTRVFDPFFTTKGKAGLGLGLAVSYGIIRRHEGIFEVESEIGRGTTFRIKLPITTNVLPSPQPSPPPVMANPSGSHERLTLLVVDDEEYVRELLKDVLEGEGYRVLIAADGAEALHIFKEKRISGVFSDVGLPGMSGWELARELRVQKPYLPIAIITGWGDSVGSEEQRAAGVEWVVTKPFNVARIAGIAHTIAERHGNLAPAKMTAILDHNQPTSSMVN